MISRRNLVMMLTMFGIVLVLFLSSVVLKEYFNDYDVNHAALEERLDRVKSDGIADARQHIFYAGSEDAEFYQPIQEWAGYRKMAFHSCRDVRTAINRSAACDKEDAWLLLDGAALETDTQEAAQALTDYVRDGGTVIFCSLPSYQTIRGCDTLRQLLGIQRLRAESVELLEIWLYRGFLLGGEECYAFDELQLPERIDMERVIPWYDISAGTKSYMIGKITAQEQQALGVSNEDLPAIIWRNSEGDGCVFAVNGDYMGDEAALGLLDAMVYESRDYALYTVVNAQNLSVTGFPDLTNENQARFMELYGFNTQQFCRDILWPSLVAAAEGQGWRISAFLSTKQSSASTSEPDMAAFVEYLKYYNEESAEAGIVLGRKEDADIRRSLTREKEALDSRSLSYGFTGSYLRPENEDQLSRLLEGESMAIFPEIRTVVRERASRQPVLSWLTDRITSQRTTVDGYRHTYKDNLRLKSLQTALGYSNVQADIFWLIWPEENDPTWESVSNELSSGIDTYWKPFSAFEKTTITESDRRVRLFLNGKLTSSASVTEEGREISIQVENFQGEAWLMLRTHGEKPKSMEGGTWSVIEQDAYLLRLTSQTARVVLAPNQEPYYYDGT